jgi:hypothetical protein
VSASLLKDNFTESQEGFEGVTKNKFQNHCEVLRSIEAFEESVFIPSWGNFV